MPMGDMPMGDMPMGEIAAETVPDVIGRLLVLF
jgi:hypothetical protein